LSGENPRINGNHSIIGCSFANLERGIVAEPKHKIKRKERKIKIKKNK